MITDLLYMNNNQHVSKIIKIMKVQLYGKPDFYSVFNVLLQFLLLLLNSYKTI